VIAEHAAPILDALRANPDIRLSDGSVKNGTVPPYVVAYIAVTTPEAASLEEAADRVVTTATIHSVGGNADAVRIIAGQVWASLGGIRPDVAGRDCSRIRLIDGRPADKDETTAQVVLDQMDVYQYVSVPAYDHAP
jgi:hypothetical protein